MAAKDKLIPTAILLANNLYATRFSTSGGYKLPAKSTSKYNNPYTDAAEFLADVYQKELLLSTGQTGPLPQANEIFSQRYTPDQNNRRLTLGSVVAFTEAEWNELQITISRMFNIIYPFNLDIYVPVFSPSEIANYETLMGVFPTDSSATFVLDSVDGPLGTFDQGVDFAEAWNSLKVPHDATLGITTPFIAPIARQNGKLIYYYRYTGSRRWFGFQGYDLK